MTTIAYRDGIIAWDSRAVDGSGVIIDDDYNKKKKISNGSYVFFSGEISAVDKLIDMWINNISQIETTLACETLICEFGKLYRVMLMDCELIQEELDLNKYYAIGSGSKYALTAMDLDLNARDAVKMAIKRDCFSGGKISTHKIK